MNAKDWKRLVAEAGCVMCRHIACTELRGQPHGPTNVHHLREGQGMSQRASDWLSVGLCKEHHQGASGWHGLSKRGFYTRYKLDELDLLAMTIEGVARLLRTSAL